MGLKEAALLFDLHFHYVKAFLKEAALLFDLRFRMAKAWCIMNKQYDKENSH